MNQPSIDEDVLNRRTEPGGEERSLGPFVLEAEIGRGGMGVVYRARRTDGGEVVAIKLMAPELSHNPRFRERFLKEAEVAPKLDHPNVVPVHETGEVDGELFIVMRLIEGVDLAELVVREGTLDIPRALAIFRQAAAALDASHEVGIVHRDVKPQNILVVPRKTPRHKDFVYLTDFGLIKPVASDTTVSRTGQIFGSVPYMAPELIENKPADGRADVYSLGCVLYECLTGTSPFSRDNEISLIWAHIHDDPPKVTGKRPELARGIDDVVIRSMSKHPDDRYLTCGEMVTDLELRSKKNVSDLAYRRMRPFIDRPKRKKTESDVWAPNYFPELSRIRATTRRISWTKVAGFAAVLVMLSSLQVGREGGIPEAIADVADAASSAGESVVDAVLGDDGSAAGKSDSPSAPAAGNPVIGSRDPRRNRGGTAGAPLGSSSDDRPTGAGTPQLTEEEVPGAEIVFASGDRCSPCSGDREIFKTVRSGSGIERLTDNDIFEDAPSWSPDGKRIAFVRQHPTRGAEIWVMRGDGSRQRRVLTVGGDANPGGGAFFSQNHIGWAPDGKRLVYSIQQAGIYVIDIDGGGWRQIFGSFGVWPEWSPDGTRIAFSKDYGNGHQIWVMDPDGSGQRAVTPLGSEATGGKTDYWPTWSPDGRRIAFGRGGIAAENQPVTGDFNTYHIYLIDADGSGMHQISSGNGEIEPSFSPAGDRLVYVTAEDLYMIGSDGAGAQRLTTNGDNGSPDWR